MEDDTDNDEFPDFDQWNERRANKTAKLIFMVQVFAKNVANIEEGIAHLYELIESQEESDAAVTSLIELAENLQVSLEACDAAILGLIGYDEPKPDMEVEDFEGSVLQDLANLDRISDEVLFNARKQGYKDELNRRGFGYV